MTQQKLAAMTGRSMRMKRLIPLLILGLGFVVSACSVPVDVSRGAPVALVPDAEIAQSAAAFAQPELQAEPRAQAAAATQPDPQRVLRRSQVNVITNDNGGDLVSYAQSVSRARIDNTQVAFNGRCASACTLYLSLSPSQTCITRGASFWFHRAYGARPDFNQWGTDYMMTRYPAWVRRWIAAHGGLSNRLMRMDYTYAAQHMRPCRMA